MSDTSHVRAVMRTSFMLVNATPAEVKLDRALALWKIFTDGKPYPTSEIAFREALRTIDPGRADGLAFCTEEAGGVLAVLAYCRDGPKVGHHVSLG